ncbi:MAG: hypothetical protein ACPG4X_14045 [Pikeienuella sp.]
MNRARLSSLSIFLSSLMAAVHLLGFAQVTTALSAVFLIIFIVLEWPFLIWAARGLVTICCGLLCAFWFMGQTTPELIGAAIDRAAFLACFVVVLSFLRDAGETSKMVETCGRIIVNQTPGRRYLTLVLGGHLMGVLMNLGSLSLLSTMVYGSVTRGPQTVEQRVRDIRLKRMTLAILRGFSAVTLWAPTSVTIAIILSSSLNLHWGDLLPLGVPALVTYLTLGWLLDRMTYQRPPPRVVVAASEPWLRPFAALLGVVFLVPLSGAVVSHLFDLSLIGGLFLCIPVIGIGWVAMQNSDAGVGRGMALALHRARTQTIPSLHGMRNELTIFATSGFLAVILLPQIDVVWLSDNITRLGLGEGLVLVAGSWAIILLALSTVNPLVSASLVIETLVRLPGMDIDPAVIALMVTMTWCIVAGISPFSASVRLTAHNVGQGAVEVGLRWNLPFALCAIALLDVVLLMLA